MTFTVRLRSGAHVSYDDVVKVKVDRKGNLRLYRSALITSHDIFHPEGEWRSVVVVG